MRRSVETAREFARDERGVSTTRVTLALALAASLLLPALRLFGGDIGAAFEARAAVSATAAR